MNRMNHPGEPRAGKAVRVILSVMMVLIALACVMSSLLALRSGDLARAASVFLAGLVFVVLIGLRWFRG